MVHHVLKMSKMNLYIIKIFVTIHYWLEAFIEYVNFTLAYFTQEGFYLLKVHLQQYVLKSV